MTTLVFSARNQYLDPARDAEVHHDLFVDVFHSVLRRGSMLEVAANAGFTEQYLFAILNQTRNAPRRESLERIIAAMPWITPREAASLRDFAQRARDVDRARATSRRLVIPPEQIRAEVERLEHASHAATHAQSTAESRQGLLAVRSESLRVVRGVLDPAAHVDSYVRLCLLLNHVQSFLDEPAEALKWARYGLAALAEGDAGLNSDADSLDVTSLHVGLLFAEAVALHNLHADRRALDTYDRIEHLLASRPDDERWVHLAMGRISALPRTRRFRIGAIKQLVDDVARQSDRLIVATDFAELVHFRAQRGLLAAHVAHDGRRKPIDALLQVCRDRLDRVAMLGPIHRVQFYGAAAQAAKGNHDRDGQEHYLTLGLQIARDAGLEHQVRQLQRLMDGPG